MILRKDKEARGPRNQTSASGGGAPRPSGAEPPERQEGNNLELVVAEATAARSQSAP